MKSAWLAIIGVAIGIAVVVVASDRKYWASHKGAEFPEVKH